MDAGHLVTGGGGAGGGDRRVHSPDMAASARRRFIVYRDYAPPGHPPRHAACRGPRGAAGDPVAPRQLIPADDGVAADGGVDVPAPGDDDAVPARAEGDAVPSAAGGDTVPAPADGDAVPTRGAGVAGPWVAEWVTGPGAADGVTVSEFTTPSRTYTVYCRTVPAGSLLFPLCSGGTATISLQDHGAGRVEDELLPGSRR